MNNTARMMEDPLLAEKNPGVTPCGFRILVWPLPAEEVTEGGIVIPFQKVERENMAQMDVEVIAIGPDAWADKKGAWCKVGDIVKIAKYSGIQFQGTDAQTYRIVNDVDVIGVCDHA